jgi:hypothetical protein
LKKGGSSSIKLGVTALLIKYFVSMSGKGGNTEMRADVPVIIFDKGIDLAVQMLHFLCDFEFEKLHRKTFQFIRPINESFRVAS